MVRRRAQGERSRRWEAVVRFDPLRHEWIMAPVGLHLALRLLDRLAYRWTLWCHRKDARDRAFTEALRREYDIAFERGRVEGHREAIRDPGDAFTRRFVVR